jgi:hypothetical protein
MAPPSAADDTARPSRVTSRPGARGRRSVRGERGSATVEFALGLPSVVVVLAFALSAVAWVLHVESAQHGAGEAARAAIVESDAKAVAIAKTASGERGVSVSRSGGFVTACVTVARAPWPAVTRCATARDRP